MEVEVKQVESLRFVGVRVEFFNSKHSVKEAVNELKKRVMEIRNIKDSSTIFGITTFQINYVVDPNNLIYYVCYEVSKFDEIHNGLEAVLLPSHAYATISYKGSMSQCQEAYRALDNWVKVNGYEQDKEASNFDIYTAQHNWHEPEHIENELTIYKAINKSK